MTVVMKNEALSIEDGGICIVDEEGKKKRKPIESSTSR
jgi:hypothetical protein